MRKRFSYCCADKPNSVSHRSGMIYIYLRLLLPITSSDSPFDFSRGTVLHARKHFAVSAGLNRIVSVRSSIPPKAGRWALPTTFNQPKLNACSDFPHHSTSERRVYLAQIETNTMATTWQYRFNLISSFCESLFQRFIKTNAYREPQLRLGFAFEWQRFCFVALKISIR